jgi:hypothetical protein
MISASCTDDGAHFSDRYHLLPATAARRKITASLDRLGLEPRAFFSSCDANGDGHLSAVELYAGPLHL